MRYGDTCSETCERCPAKTCNFADGTCDHDGEYCEDHTFYGDKCSINCNQNRPNCVECLKAEGECRKCKDDKFYGDNCEDSCENCPGGTCNYTGKCIDTKNNCKDNLYKGENCNVQCNATNEYCETCNREGTCLSCKDNLRYGDTCSETCENCPGGTCDFDGTCDQYGEYCEDHTVYGPQCKTKCNEGEGRSHCEECLKDGGRCTLCDLGFFGDNCEEDCSNCPDKSCYITGICTDESKDCIDKIHYGENCTTPCTEGGYDNCESCSRKGICSKCKDDKYFGDHCETPCDTCPDGTCETNGKCLDTINNCKDDLYKGDYCNENCNETNIYCETCDRQGTCLSCKDKLKYGNECVDSCDKCPGEICEFNGNCTNEGDCKDYKYYESKCQEECNKIGEFCDTCYRKGTCKSCIDELHYGDKCEDTCDTCPDKSCNMKGICTDSTSNCVNDSYYGDSCEYECKELSTYCYKCNRTQICIECSDDHYYGPKCEDMCSTCPGETCDNDGTCINQKDNCLNNDTYGTKCTEECTTINPNCEKCNRDETCSHCKNNNYYGKECENDCSHCPNKECYTNGDCIDTEEDCPDNHYFGINCSISCKTVNERCVTCHRDGNCTSCTTMEYWGNECDTYCDNCPGNMCLNSGNCEDKENNCINSNYTGEKCDEPCTDINENCLYCNRQKKCFECIDKTKFGEECSTPCGSCPEPFTCNNSGVCNNTKDICFNPIYTGENCSVLCKDIIDPNCDKCNREYICTECDNKEFYGDDCTQSCSNCPGNCDIKGNCVDNSTKCDNDTFTGVNCSVLCQDIHPNCKRCDRYHICLECIDKDFYGNSCEDSCERCPGPCEIDGICVDNETICDNDEYTGVNCSVLCKDIHPNCKRCERNNTCLECIDKEFFGNSCEEPCKNCPGEGEKGYCDINGICIDNLTKCDDDSYTGDNCSVLCSDIHSNCKRCDRNNICLECIDKDRFGPTCEDPCDNCPGFCNISGICDDSEANCKDDHFTGNNCSVSCDEKYSNCDRCDRNNKCLECKDKLSFGDTCETPCFNCPDTGECDINGDCLDNITVFCKDDSYTGKNCSVLCNVKYDNCDRCFRNNTCIECIDKEFYGDECKNSCKNCPIGDEGFCYNNGTCEDQSSLCDDSSFTGEGCDILCKVKYDNCLQCDRNNSCFECIDKTSYGEQCNISCGNCPGECNNTGFCDDQETQCENPEYTGKKCDELCIKNVENCLECERNNTCTLCKERIKFGEKCDQDCGHCPGEGLCHINGTCEDTSLFCKDDSYTGDDCNVSCTVINSNCKRCDRNNKCIECFNKLFYGDKCNTSCENCPDFCYINGTCNDTISLCKDSTFTGPGCNESCSETIYENCERCNRDYNCIECFNKTFYGSSCNISCGNCPTNCTVEGICDDQTSLCVNDTKTGPNCEKECTDISKYCKRCNREEKCTECSTKRAFGDKCEESCVGCTEAGCNILGYCHEFKCKNASFGLGCDLNCTCESNSNNPYCGKFGGQCLDCKFGYYGKNCDKHCNYKCQTELCCFIKSLDGDFEPLLEIKTNYKYLVIEINGEDYNIEIDYNYGYPLTLINDETQIDSSCNKDNFHRVNYHKEKQRDKYSQNFTHYFINGSHYDDQKIKLKNTEVKNVDLTIAELITCDSKEAKDKKISGLIGLGFFNSISNSFFSNETQGKGNKLNILSYHINGNDDVQLYFGNMFEEQHDYVERLTSCNVILDTESDIQAKKMTCELDGIKSAKYTEAFKLREAEMTFSLGEKSSLILGNNSIYAKYLEQVYFQEDFKVEFDHRDNKVFKYYLYPSDKINKLPNFGFVFNKFFYSYSPVNFFNSEEQGKKRFLIEINLNSTKTEFILGKEFLKDIKFTINNEEAKIYFYAKNAEFSDEFTEVVDDNIFRIKLDARESAAISLSAIVFINLVAFSIFFCVKRSKGKESD